MDGATPACIIPMKMEPAEDLTGAEHDGELIEQPRLGASLRRLRRQRGHTIAAVADAAGLSNSFIALVEKGRSDISLGRLYRLLRFYGVGLGELLPKARREEVIRRGDARHLSLPTEGMHAFLLAPDTRRRMMPMLAIHEPGAQVADVPPFEGECFLYVLEGTLLVEREGKEPVVLGEGDAFYFTRSESLTSSTVGLGAARVIAVLAPPVS